MDPDILENFRMMVLGGATPEDAALRIQRMARLDDATRDSLLNAYRATQEGWQRLKNPPALKEKDRTPPWYPGPDFPSAWSWPAYKAMLKANPDWTDQAFADLDAASTKILAHLPHPTTERYQTRGLVVGYVQSGKTANYSGLIAKAADVRFKLFVILAGTTENLRRQTQERLEGDICSHHPDRWKRLTFSESDFGQTQDQPDSLLSPIHTELRVICVVKKNKDVLDNLIGYLSSASPEIRAACPTIVIDDEADHASINTKANRQTEVDKRTAINKRILDLVHLFPRAAYIGYTATPFANVFIDAASDKDLFPRSFIFALPRPAAYFGSEKIFGRDVFWFDESDKAFEGMNIVRQVLAGDPDDDTVPDEVRMLAPGKKQKDSFEPEMTPSLERAILYFLLATACRYARGQDGKHSSMLVHVSLFRAQHAKLQSLLARFIESLRRSGGWRGRRMELEQLWQEECATTAAIAAGRVTNFAEVASKLDEVLTRCEVVVDNSDDEAGPGLVYPKTGPAKVYIGVGGNTLSRGLTLEGLIVSYFIRVASNYDTLLQMGRWFGYRKGYEDLPRVWMTEQLETYFLFLAGVEEEIRQDIDRLDEEGRTPLDFAIRVRTHPRLQVTAKNKMGQAGPSALSFGNTREQSFYFRNREAAWLQSNLLAGRTLLSALRKAAGGRPPGPPYVFKEVDGGHVVRFLQDYAFHEQHAHLSGNLLTSYIEREMAAKSLMTWNVAVMSRSSEGHVVLGRESREQSLGSLDLGLGANVWCINRSRYRWSAPCNIKALTSQPDGLVDLPEAPKTKLTTASIAATRNSLAARVGLLLLYPISRHSAPEEGDLRECERCKMWHLIPPSEDEDTRDQLRHPLNAVEDVLGAAMLFPRPESRLDGGYIANVLPLLEAEEEDDDADAGGGRTDAGGAPT